MLFRADHDGKERGEGGEKGEEGAGRRRKGKRERRERENCLISFATAEASVEIFPSAWLDAPPGEKGEGGWTVQRPYRFIMVLLLPAFGCLLILSYLGAATFNAKRAMFMRVRRPQAPASGGSTSPNPTHGSPRVDGDL